MRSLCPVAHSEQYGGFWVVTKYEDVLRVAQDWESFSSAHGLTVPVAPILVRNLPVEVDPPLHRVYKRLINAYFTPMAIQPWEESTRHLATRLIDQFIESGRCEFMADFARQYPALSFFDIALNAPSEEIERVAYLASKSSIPNDPEAAACWAGLSEWIARFVEARRQQPRRDDVVDGVLNAEIEGRPITEEEIVGIIQLLILGGLETTAGALGPDDDSLLQPTGDSGPPPRPAGTDSFGGGGTAAPGRTLRRHRPYRYPRHGGRRAHGEERRQGHHLLGISRP